MIAVIPAEAGIQRFDSGCAGLDGPGRRLRESAMEPISKAARNAATPVLAAFSRATPATDSGTTRWS